ncbi:MAG: HNH endonuclease [Caldilineaceae bacterium]|nr:HNH endonuclease [Caldilineaceae bacterium]
MTRRLFEYLVARDGPRCLCGRDLTEWPVTLDHLHPLALAVFYAGPDIHGPANLQLLCRSCNRAKGARIQARPIRRRFRQPSLWQALP